MTFWRMRCLRLDPLGQALLAPTDPIGCIDHLMVSIRSPFDRFDLEFFGTWKIRQRTSSFEI